MCNCDMKVGCKIFLARISKVLKYMPNSRHITYPVDISGAICMLIVRNALKYLAYSRPQLGRAVKNLCSINDASVFLSTWVY